MYFVLLFKEKKQLQNYCLKIVFEYWAYIPADKPTNAMYLPQQCSSSHISSQNLVKRCLLKKTLTLEETSKLIVVWYTLFHLFIYSFKDQKCFLCHFSGRYCWLRIYLCIPENDTKFNPLSPAGAFQFPLFHCLPLEVLILYMILSIFVLFKLYLFATNLILTAYHLKKQYNQQMGIHKCVHFLPWNCTSLLCLIAIKY